MSAAQPPMLLFLAHVQKQLAAIAPRKLRIFKYVSGVIFGVPYLLGLVVHDQWNGAMRAMSTDQVEWVGEQYHLGWLHALAETRLRVRDPRLKQLLVAQGWGTDPEAPMELRLKHTLWHMPWRWDHGPQWGLTRIQTTCSVGARLPGAPELMVGTAGPARHQHQIAAPLRTLRVLVWWPWSGAIQVRLEGPPALVQSEGDPVRVANRVAFTVQVRDRMLEGTVALPALYVQQGDTVLGVLEGVHAYGRWQRGAEGWRPDLQACSVRHVAIAGMALDLSQLRFTHHCAGGGLPACVQQARVEHLRLGAEDQGPLQGELRMDWDPAGGPFWRSGPRHATLEIAASDPINPESVWGIWLQAMLRTHWLEQDQSRYHTTLERKYSDLWEVNHALKTVEDWKSVQQQTYAALRSSPQELHRSHDL